MSRLTRPLLLILAIHPAARLPAQTLSGETPRPWAANIVVPQCRSFGTAHPDALHIAGVDVQVSIVEQVATTTMDIRLTNPTGRRLEAELLVPVPDGAAVRGFAFDGAASQPTAQLLPAPEARRTYEAIVAQIKDPALLEFVGCNLVRSSVFPVEAGGAQRVRLTYEHLLSADGDRVDYVLPRSEALGQVTPWNVSVQIKSAQPISTVYSPSHPVDTRRSGDGSMTVNLQKTAATEPGSFRLSCLKGGSGVSASLMAYPDAKGDGGYFLLLAGLPEKPANADAKPMKREVTLVIDRSGSMSGEKIVQVKEAAKQIVGALDEGESFNIYIYNDGVQAFSPAAVAKSAGTVKLASGFIEAVTANGGTNIHDALLQALSQPATPDTVPLVLFMTDGLPTVGNTSEMAIRNVAMQSNPHQRRIFTFGVGYDVNAPLLQKISDETRAASTFVLPDEVVEVKVAGVFKRLQGPVLTGAQLTATTADNAKTVAVMDLIPDRLPDLFVGDQLVLLGRYLHADAGLRFTLNGAFMGQPRTFAFTFPLEKATTRNAFIPRLWASRRIAQLVDAIRQMGADASASAYSQAVAHSNAHAPALAGSSTILPPGAAHSAALPAVPGAGGVTGDPKVKELVDEIVRLSTEFGVLTEYTAFLAHEGTDLSKRDALLAEACGNLEIRAVQTRAGVGAVNQASNYQAQVAQGCSNYSNRYWDANMNRVEITGVQQVCDRAFFNRSGRWIDSRLVGKADSAPPQRTVTFGSAEFSKLLERLAVQNRSGCVSLRGDILLDVDGETVLIKSAADASAALTK